MNLPMSICYSQIFNIILFCAVLRICIEKCVYGSGCDRFGGVQAIDPFSPSNLVIFLYLMHIINPGQVLIFNEVGGSYVVIKFRVLTLQLPHGAISF